MTPWGRGVILVFSLGRPPSHTRTPQQPGPDMKFRQSVECQFPVMSEEWFSLEYHYALLGALTNLQPKWHGGGEDPRRDLLVGPIACAQRHPGFPRVLKIKTTKGSSFLSIRIPLDKLHETTEIENSIVEINGIRLMIGTKKLAFLKKVSCLRARMVTFKSCLDKEDFTRKVIQDLSEKEIKAQVRIEKIKTLFIKNKKIVGFSVILNNLSPEDSLKIQSLGMGGRVHMGCGFFVPFNPKYLA